MYFRVVGNLKTCYSVIRNIELCLVCCQVKRKIHSSIGFHLETLHCRELQLLEEVDAVVGAEEHLLDDHQSCLGRTLSLLRSGVPGVECDNMINSATSTPLFNHEWSVMAVSLLTVLSVGSVVSVQIITFLITVLVDKQLFRAFSECCFLVFPPFPVVLCSSKHF